MGLRVRWLDERDYRYNRTVIEGVRSALARCFPEGGAVPPGDDVAVPVPRADAPPPGPPPSRGDDVPVEAPPATTPATRVPPCDDLSQTLEQLYAAGLSGHRVELAVVTAFTANSRLAEATRRNGSDLRAVRG